MAFLSVIIAAHNAEATLHATLSSLLAATVQGTEIIIFNDSSEDTTQAIIEEWSPKFPQIITRTVNFRNVGRYETVLSHWHPVNILRCSTVTIA